MDYQAIIDKKVPDHIAIILDGNGRWAKKRGLPRTAGHKSGLDNLETITKICDEIGVKSLTVYAFSTENWGRPFDEVNYLMNLPIIFFSSKISSIEKSNIKINIIGRKTRIPKNTLDALDNLEEKTKNHQGLKLNICFDYGAYEELTTAVKQISQNVLDGNMKVEDINYQTIQENLYKNNQTPIDLLIRTSGEIRISNFLLWQIAYSELYFTDCYWPDFDKDELFKAIESYQNRSRRFGGLERSESK